MLRSQTELEQIADIRESLIRELETKNVELERFTYTVSHDLKSPLVTVKGFIGLLKQDIKNGDSKGIESDIDHIANASDKMALLLDDLLELSRIGRVLNKPETIQVSDLFKEVITTLQGQIAETQAKIDIQNHMPSIYADRHRMHEVAQNLLDNAMKFSRQNGVPEISVRARLDGNRILCFVSGNGIDITPDYQNRIFGPFDRLDQSFAGTGVGLTLVKRIIEVHYGNLTVESAGEGSGSIFCFLYLQHRTRHYIRRIEKYVRRNPGRTVAPDAGGR